MMSVKHQTAKRQQVNPTILQYENSENEHKQNWSTHSWQWTYAANISVRMCFSIVVAPHLYHLKYLTASETVLGSWGLSSQPSSECPVQGEKGASSFSCHSNAVAKQLASQGASEQLAENNGCLITADWSFMTLASWIIIGHWWIIIGSTYNNSQ